MLAQGAYAFCKDAGPLYLAGSAWANALLQAYAPIALAFVAV
ncbi:hypothetical protein L584_01910 [Pantoea agglomerans Tx10]|nr:hypothetical protein L584_01910 [Pantoea agglomerans Tx10]